MDPDKKKALEAAGWKFGSVEEFLGKAPMSEQKLSSYIHWEPKLYRVRIRRDWPVKPEAEKIDGKVFAFRFAWLMDESDQYPYEMAMVPDDPYYPKDAPIWIASGDLIAEGRPMNTDDEAILKLLQQYAEEARQFAEKAKAESRQKVADIEQIVAETKKLALSIKGDQ